MIKQGMFVVWLAGAMSVFGAGLVSAHCGKCGMPGDHADKGKMAPVEEKVERLGKSLGLTADQKAQLKPILEETWAKKDALMQQHKEQMDALHKEKADRVSALLTPEQKAKWDAMKQEGPMKKGGKGKMKGCGHCGTGECVCDRPK